MHRPQPPRRPRPLIALAAMLVIPAKTALATSPVEIARAQEPAAETQVSLAASQEAPVGPLVVPLALREPEPQIQLRAVEREQRDAGLFDLHFAVSTAVDPNR